MSSTRQSVTEEAVIRSEETGVLPGGPRSRVPLSAVRWRRVASAFADSKVGLVGLAFLVFVVLFSFVGPLLYHPSHSGVNLLDENLKPGAGHILGTTPEGFDELSRLMIGGQSTLVVAFGSAIVATIVGMAYGMLSGYAGGFPDALAMRFVDALFSIPYIFFLILLAALIQPTLLLIVIVLAAVSWLSTARIARGETLSFKTRDYVAAAVNYGSKPRSILFRHIAPNLIGPLAVSATFMVADNLLAFATLSYLGIGLPPPATSWGALLSQGIDNLLDGYWWQLWPPAILIVLTVLSVSAVGDALRDALDSRLYQR